MKPLPIATLLWLARDLPDLTFAKWERAVRHRPDEMTRVALHADADEFRDTWHWPRGAIKALVEWRDERAQDDAAKREDDDAAAELQRRITREVSEG